MAWAAGTSTAWQYATATAAAAAIYVFASIRRHLASCELASSDSDLGSSMASSDFFGRCLGHMDRIPGMDGQRQQHDSETNIIRNPSKENG